MNKHLYFGKCLCGKIRFQALGPVIWMGYCHCQSCRRATGSAAVTHVGIKDTSLKILRGRIKIFNSSVSVKRGFCADCGSPISYQADHFPDYIQLYIGSFDEPNRLTPQAHVHVEEKISWFEINDELPRFVGSAAQESDDWKN